jgi:hypothetical protein
MKQAHIRTCWVCSYSLDTILNPCLEYDNIKEETTEEPEGEKAYYEELDLFVSIEGVDRDIVYGVEGEEEETETWIG